MFTYYITTKKRSHPRRIAFFNFKILQKIILIVMVGGHKYV